MMQDVSLAASFGRLLVVAAGAVVLTGCSTNHGPKSFDDATLISNYLESCKTANPDKKDIADAVTFCECTYNAIKEEFTFDEFKTLDEKLRDALADEKTAPKNENDLKSIDSRYVDVVAGCRTSGPSTPTTTAAK